MAIIGRPRLDKEKKVYPVQVSFSKKEYDFLQTEADKQKQTIASLIRELTRSTIYEAPSIPMEDSILVHLRGKQRRISRQEARELTTEIINKI